MKKAFAILNLIIAFNYFTIAQVPNWTWAKSEGGALDDFGTSITTDLNGNVIVTGYFESSTITFGTTTLTNSGWGSSDLFIVKYDSNGNVIWAKSTGNGNGDVKPSGVSTDINGNVFVTGSFSSSNFGSFPNMGAYDLFIIKYNSSGNMIWLRCAGGANFDGATGIAISANGEISLTGLFNSPSISFGTTTLTNAGEDDIFIVKYDANGNVLWAKSAGGADWDQSLSVGIDTGGNVFVCGRFGSPSIIFGSTTLTNNIFSYDIFIAKYDSIGNVAWAKSVGGYSFDSASGLATDAAGNVFITGYFTSDSISFGSLNLINSGSDDIFIAKYDPNGNVIWAGSAGGWYSERGHGISSDTNGNAFLTGYFDSPSITFGSTVLFKVGDVDIFVVKYDSSGYVEWAKSAGGLNMDWVTGIASSPNGNVHVTGFYTSPSIVFDSTTIINAGNRDIFIASIQSSLTGIGEIPGPPVFSIDPNPLTSQSTIFFDELQTNTTISVRDVMGKEIRTDTFSGNQYILERGNMQQGVYFVTLKFENSTIATSKIVIH